MSWWHCAGTGACSSKCADDTGECVTSGVNYAACDDDRFVRVRPFGTPPVTSGTCALEWLASYHTLQMVIWSGSFGHTPLARISPPPHVLRLIPHCGEANRRRLRRFEQRRCPTLLPKSRLNRKKQWSQLLFYEHTANLPSRYANFCCF